MSTVQEIESAIEKLNDEHVAEICAWRINRTIARDAASSALAALADEAIREPSSTGSASRSETIINR